MKSPKSPIIRLFQRAILQAKNSEFEFNDSRRNFIKNASIASLTTFVASDFISCVTKKDIKVAIIGGGNLGASIAEGLIKSKFVTAQQLTVTRRNTDALFPLKAQGVHRLFPRL